MRRSSSHLRFHFLGSAALLASPVMPSIVVRAGSDSVNSAALPLCQMGMSGNTAGKFRMAANVACDTK